MVSSYVDNRLVGGFQGTLGEFRCSHVPWIIFKFNLSLYFNLAQILYWLRYQFLILYTLKLQKSHLHSH